MRLHLICLGSRQPRWINEGFETYARRMPRECALGLIEIPARRGGKSADERRSVERESERAIRAIPDGALVVALDEGGQLWSTQQLSERLDQWRQLYQDVALLIGGADGLAPACLERAEMRWSLSPMTLPHGLARIMAAEQLYRAWTILNGHPYHRE